MAVQLRHLCAFVVLSNDAPVSKHAELRAELKHNLRRAGSAIPSVIRFVQSLPLTSSGKVDAARLQELAMTVDVRCV